MLTAALVIGAAVSLLLTELVGLSAGGIVSPGYIALLLDQPVALGAVMAIALAVFVIVRFLATHLILFGSRRFAVTVMAGVTIHAGLEAIWPAVLATALGWAGLGHIVPGLIAHQFDRQGILPTLTVLAIAAPLVRVALLVMAVG
jgi:gamma-polyglutamate biosynthesis protein CapC